MGYSWNCTVENNTIIGNRLAGIAVENGRFIKAENNKINENHTGILLWSDWSHQNLECIGPKGKTSHDWLIKNNEITDNRKGIRIANEQNQGTISLPSDQESKIYHRPYNHVIQSNTISKNYIGVELSGCDKTTFINNILKFNEVTDIKEFDCIDTKFIADVKLADNITPWLDE